MAQENNNQSEIRYLNPVSVDVKKKKYCRFKKLGITKPRITFINSLPVKVFEKLLLSFFSCRLIQQFVTEAETAVINTVTVRLIVLIKIS